MKKKVLSLLLASAMVLGLVACGSGEPAAESAPASKAPAAESSAASDAGAAAEDVALTFAWWGNQTRKATMTICMRSNILCL